MSPIAPDRNELDPELEISEVVYQSEFPDKFHSLRSWLFSKSYTITGSGTPTIRLVVDVDCEPSGNVITKVISISEPEGTNGDIENSLIPSKLINDLGSISEI